VGVPDFQSLMLPLLRIAGDGKEHLLAEARVLLGSEFKLTQDERLPSGRQSRFANRVAWAKVYLEQGGLLLSPRRGLFLISDRGREVLKAPPARIDIKFLGQYPEFIEFRRPKTEAEEPSVPAIPEAPDEETPEEALETAHAKIKASLASEALARVKAGSPDFFEKLVVELLLKMGYGGSRTDAGQAVGKAGDEGIDGVISEDRLGWTSSTFRPRDGMAPSDGPRSRSSWALSTGNVPRRACSSQRELFRPMRRLMLNTSIPGWFSSMAGVWLSS